MVAGVPPDYFSATGQRWGNPLYRWQRMQSEGFRFWLDRIRTQMRLFDMVRIDHFRGFEAYWEIPASEEYAINGRWVKALGDELFERLHQRFGPLPLIAEDLGVITDAVDALRKKYRLPGMKVLQFAFSGEATNPYLPFHHAPDSVVYTGTHDNDTTLLAGIAPSLTPGPGLCRRVKKTSGAPCGAYALAADPLRPGVLFSSRHAAHAGHPWAGWRFPHERPGYLGGELDLAILLGPGDAGAARAASSDARALRALTAETARRAQRRALARGCGTPSPPPHDPRSRIL